MPFPNDLAEVMVPAMRLSRRLIAPIVLIAALIAIWVLAPHIGLSWATVARYQTALTDAVAEHPLVAPLIYVVVYTASVALSLPQAALLTILGGLLFGPIRGGSLAVVGATAGAILLFLLARYAFADVMRERGGAALTRLRADLERNGFSYLLALRLVPIVPFWLLNLAAAFCGMRLAKYAVATLIGIMPATFITAWIGAGVGGVLTRGEKPDLSVLFSWQVLTPLAALALLALGPVVWRKWRPRRA
jgi:uncharacterized membrane protein YdjX (TVP38/TMEM64 family)